MARICHSICVGAALVLSSLAVAQTPQPTEKQKSSTERVSVGPAGGQGNRDSFSVALSANGRFVAFDSPSNNFVPNDTNAVADVFVQDRLTGAIERVNVGTSGNQADDDSGGAALSADGRFIAFLSRASNLVAGDTNGFWDAFVRDRQTGTTERVSVDGSGNQGNNETSGLAFSADGRFVAFGSMASNLVPGDTNGLWDIFVRDRQSGTTERVSVDSSGNQSNHYSFMPALSADGRFVAFFSYATNLVPDKTTSFGDIFVHDRETRTTRRVSVDSSGNQSDNESSHPAFSADGRFVVFLSGATNLVPNDTNSRADVFVHDLQTGITTCVSVDSAGNQGDGDSYTGGLSASSGDGRFVVFHSSSTNLVKHDSNGVHDVFLHDRQTRITTRVSVDSRGKQGDNESNGGQALSADGSVVAFGSLASNLVDGDTNGLYDVFVHNVEVTKK